MHVNSYEMKQDKIVEIQHRKSPVISTTNVITFKNKKDGKKMVNHYKIIKTLGKGSYSTVKLCIDTKLNDYYAMKLMNKKQLKK